MDEAVSQGSKGKTKKVLRDSAELMKCKCALKQKETSKL